MALKATLATALAKVQPSRKINQDFPGSSAVENPSANAREKGSTLLKKTHVTEQLNPYATTTEARGPKAHALQQGTPL